MFTLIKGESKRSINMNLNWSQRVDLQEKVSLGDLWKSESKDPGTPEIIFMSRICTVSAQDRPEWCVPRIILPAVSTILTSFMRGDVCSNVIRRSQTHINSQTTEPGKSEFPLGIPTSPQYAEPSCWQPVPKVWSSFLLSEPAVWPWVGHLTSLVYVSSFVQWGWRMLTFLSGPLWETAH